MSFQGIKKKLKNNKRIFSTYMNLIGKKKEESRLRRANETLHQHGMEYILMIEKTLETKGARYFVNFGSLMGLLREGRFIAWDNDIDYGIYIDENFTWDDLKNAMAECGMVLERQFRHDGVITEQTYKSSRITIDFFEHIEDEEYSYEYVYFKKKGYEYSDLLEFHVCRLKMYKFLGLEKKELNGVEFTIPQNADEYLASVYTKSWRTPDPNWVSEKGPAWNEIPGAIGHAEFFNNKPTI